MKNFIRNIIIVSAIIFSSCQLQPAFAADKEFCLTQLELAETIMKARQAGVSIKDVLNFNKETSKEVKEHLTILTEYAYTKPRFSTEEYKRKAIVEFGTEIYNICRKAK